MVIAVFAVGMVVVLAVAIAACGDARNADSDHPYGSCTDRRNEQ